MKRITPVAILLLVILVTGCAGVGDLSVSDPRCEYRVNPLGIDASQPRLGWRLASDVRAQRQAAYQILVASSEDLLTEEKADLWNTGRVASDLLHARGDHIHGALS